MKCLFPLQKETTLVQLIKKKQKKVFLHFAKTTFTLQISNQLKNRLGTAHSETFGSQHRGVKK